MPTYVYNILTPDETPTGERFEVFQHMRDDAFTRCPETGRPCRRAIVATKSIKIARPPERIRWKDPGGAVHNPHLKIPMVSETLAYDDRKGTPGMLGSEPVRVHDDGTMTTMDHRPIVRTRDDSKKFVERERARGLAPGPDAPEKPRRPVAKNLARRHKQ